MSDSPGIENFSGSDSTSATRHSFGKPNPITVPSFENDRKTIRPTRNFIRPRTNASLLRDSVAANARTSSTVTGTTPGYEPHLVESASRTARDRESARGGWARMWAEGAGDRIRRRRAWLLDEPSTLVSALRRL